ncbi:MAG: pyroglutamyl-peptidase I [Anaerolineales bacterium]
MNILLTGFEPFGGSDLNPSEQVVRALAARPPRRVRLATAILPVDQEKGPEVLWRAVEQNRPEAVLCLGEAAGRAAISIERLAVNLLDFRIADNAGRQVSDQPIVPAGPAAYFVTLPVRAILTAIQQAGIPAELSLSAGAFLCNQVTYVLLHRLHERGGVIPAGFIHLPALPEQAARRSPPIPSMSLASMEEAVRIALQVIARSG